MISNSQVLPADISNLVAITKTISKKLTDVNEFYATARMNADYYNLNINDYVNSDEFTNILNYLKKNMPDLQEYDTNNIAPKFFEKIRALNIEIDRLTLLISELETFNLIFSAPQFNEITAQLEMSSNPPVSTTPIGLPKITEIIDNFIKKAALFSKNIEIEMRDSEHSNLGTIVNIDEVRRLRESISTKIDDIQKTLDHKNYPECFKKICSLNNDISHLTQLINKLKAFNQQFSAPQLSETTAQPKKNNATDQETSEKFLCKVEQSQSQLQQWFIHFINATITNISGEPDEYNQIDKTRITHDKAKTHKKVIILTHVKDWLTQNELQPEQEKLLMALLQEICLIRRHPFNIFSKPHSFRELDNFVINHKLGNLRDKKSVIPADLISSILNNPSVISTFLSKNSMPTNVPTN